MKKLKYVRLTFDNTLALHEIPAFRAALAKLYPESCVLLHHHLSDEKLLYHYPLIQYKIYRQQPCIVALEEGTNIVLKLAEKAEQTIYIHNHPLDLAIRSLDLHHHLCHTWQKNFTYKIYHWLALNSENYQKFLKTESLKERIQMLEKILTGHIISFIEELKCDIYEPIVVTIHRIHAERWLRYKKIQFLTFELTFETNISLPDYLSIGKAASVGFGMIRKVKIHSANNQEKESLSQTILTDYE